MEDSSGCPKQTEATAVSGLEVIKTRQFANKAKFPLSNESQRLTRHLGEKGQKCTGCLGGCFQVKYKSVWLAMYSLISFAPTQRDLQAEVLPSWQCYLALQDGIWWVNALAWTR